MLCLCVLGCNVMLTAALAVNATAKVNDVSQWIIQHICQRNEISKNGIINFPIQTESSQYEHA